MESIPLHSYDLITLLDKEFPARCARKGMTPEDIWIEAGRREVVDALVRLRAEEQDNILSKPSV